MPLLRIYTKQDKAAFLNKCKANNILLSTENIKQSKNKKYFIVKSTPKEISKIRQIFASNPNFKVIGEQIWKSQLSLLELFKTK